MKSTTTTVRSVLLAAALAATVVGCGSSDGDAKPAVTTQPSGRGGGSETGSGGAITDETVMDGTGTARPAGDPCARIAAADMARILGLDEVTTADKSVGTQSTCGYDNDAAYVSVEVSLVLPDAFNETKIPDEVPVAGVGDEAWGMENKGGATLLAKKGDRVVQVLIANGGGGPEAGNVADGPKSLEVAKEIANTLLSA